MVWYYEQLAMDTRDFGYVLEWHWKHKAYLEGDQAYDWTEWDKEVIQ